MKRALQRKYRENTGDSRLASILSAVIPIAGIVVIIALAVVYRTVRVEAYPTYYSENVLASSEEFGIPADVIFSVIRTESDFRPAVVSKSGAIGLMQIMPGGTLDDINYYLGTDYTAEDLYEPSVNVRCGTRYLKYLYDRFGDWDIVFVAYNAGPTITASWLENDEYSRDGKLVKIPYAQADRYLYKVNKALKNYKQIYYGKYE